MTFNVLIPMTSPSWRNKTFLLASVKRLKETGEFFHQPQGQIHAPHTLAAFQVPKSFDPNFWSLLTKPVVRFWKTDVDVPLATSRGGMRPGQLSCLQRASSTCRRHLSPKARHQPVPSKYCVTAQRKTTVRQSFSRKRESLDRNSKRASDKTSPLSPPGLNRSVLLRKKPSSHKFLNGAETVLPAAAASSPGQTLRPALLPVCAVPRGGPPPPLRPRVPPPETPTQQLGFAACFTCSPSGLPAAAARSALTTCYDIST